MTTIVIVDDHPAVRTGVERFLDAEPGLSVAAAVATAAEAEAACEEHRPDVLVADYHLPDGDGLTLCLRLAESSGLPVVLFSALADDSLDVLAMIAGARTLVSKGADPLELIAAVQAAARGARLGPAPNPRALNAAGERLDPNDLPVLGMLAHGVAPDEIARTLGIDEDWLGMRRRAMLERLRGGRSPGRPRHGRRGALDVTKRPRPG